MNNVAFVTYNNVGRSLPSGWHDGPDGRRAFVLQNSRGDQFAVDPFYRGDLSDYSRRDHADYVRDEIGNLWTDLQKAIPELDHVVVYVGASGSERAIALASELPSAKVTFVACDCGLPKKELMICAAGLAEAGRFLCECGGNRTMNALYEYFMETGMLPTVEPD